MRRKIGLSVMLAFAAFYMANGQVPVAPAHWDKLKSYLHKSATADSLLLPAQVAFSIRDMDSNKEMLGLNAQKAMIPASNLKLVTTITALDLLGPDYRYSTRIFIDGTVSDGVLNGNLIIEGSGDPTLGGDRYSAQPTGAELTNDVARTIAAKGIRKVTGNIIIAAFHGDINPVPNGWPWGDMGNYYGAPSYGLNFMENMIKVTFQAPNRVNQPTIITRIQPSLPDYTIINEVKSGKPNSGDESIIYSSPGSTTILMQGTVATAAGKESIVVKGSHPAPHLLFSQYLRTSLASVNIALTGKDSVFYRQADYTNSRYELITIIQSPRLGDIVNKTNLLSINLYAESLFKSIGKKLKTAPVYDSICVAVKKYWKQKGLSVAGMNLTDGSGLSYNNTASTSQMTALLAYASKMPWYGELKSSLPIAGVSSTLYKLCKGTNAEGKISAKTGTLTRVCCYSGVFSRLDKSYSFSLMVNNYEGKSSTLAKWVEKVFCKMTEE